MRHLGLFLLLTLLSSPVLRAAGNVFSSYNMTYMNVTSGLPNNFVDDIFEDSHGFIWMATRAGGLVRYDGYGYDSFGIGSRGVQLKSNSCRNVSEDRFGRLWVSFEECTEVLSLATLRPVVPQCAAGADPRQLARLLAEPSVRTYRDASGAMWVVTLTRVCRLAFDGEGRVVSILSRPYHSNTPDVPLADADDGGGVLIGYGGTVRKFYVRGRRILEEGAFRGKPSFNNLYVTRILRSGSTLWYATNSGLYAYDGTRERVFHYRPDGRGLSHDFVSDIAMLPGGRLLAGTLNGIDIIDPDGRVDHWNASSPVNPLPSNFVNCLLWRHGLLWVGTESGGAARLSPRLLKIDNYTHSSAPGSLSPNAVNAILTTPGGTLWVGTVEGGLNKRVRGSRDFVHFTTANSALPHNSVSCLAADDQGRLWIGTWGGGVCSLDTATGAMTRLAADVVHQPLLTFVGTLTFDKANRGLWIGTNDGVYFYSFAKKIVEDPFVNCREIRGCIGSLLARDHTLYIGCIEGMVRVFTASRPTGTGMFVASRTKYKLDRQRSGIVDKIDAFCQARDGSLWMGSNGYGLYHYRKDSTGHWAYKAYTTKEGLANNGVKGIAEDRKGSIWITTDHGLSVLNPRTGVFTNFTEADGLVSSQFYFNSAVASADGRIFLGTDRGLVEVDGENRTQAYPGRLCFTRLQVNNEPAQADGRWLDDDISVASDIHLHESDHSIEIAFSALNYGTETQGVYSYRMRGLEEEWIPLPPGQHSVRYSALPGGSYRFEVRYASAASGARMETRTINIRVTPYFYKSWWFVSLLLLAFAGGATYAYRVRMRKMRQAEADRLYRPIEAALRESDNPGKLQQRIKSILENDQRYRTSQAKSLEADKVATNRNARPFMEEVMEIMESNYTNPDFGVQELCAALGLTRSVMSQKLNAEVGVPTAKFIRNYRLDVARSLLVDNPADRNITEIAYKVGFNDPKYFTRCFTRHFGVPPTGYKGQGG